MKRIWLIALAGVCSATPLRAQAQQNTPHLGYIYPAGAQQGSTIHVMVGGQYLARALSASISGKGVTARVVDYERPATAQELSTLRDTAQALQQRLRASGGRDVVVRQQLETIVEKVAATLRRRTNPALSELVLLEVSVAADAEPGRRSLRLSTPLGTTAPLTFQVGQLPEFRENERKQTKADAELPITLPAVVNGRLIPGSVGALRYRPAQGQPYREGDVDRYRFSAHKGQQLVAIASARDLIPFLADAVPGWLQATLTLYDAGGHEVAYCDDYTFHPDPVLHYEVPADGEYVLEIKDALYRGREDFIYRIAIGELPFVTTVFPLGGRAGANTRTELRGWNLGSTSHVFDGTHKIPGTYPLTDHLQFALDTLPEVFEKESAQSAVVKLNTIINGRVDRPGDWDAFSFQGKAGDTIVAEVRARRLGSPLDAVLELRDASGRRIVANDDYDDNTSGLETHHADAWFMTTLPANGTYSLRIGDAQQKGGPEYGYRLRIGAPRPDFELRVSPSALNASAGGTVPLTITAVRRDGFNGDIALSLHDAPRGASLSGAIVPAGQSEIRVTLTVPGFNALPTQRSLRAATLSSLAESSSMRLEGTARIGNRNVVHRALPADRMMQAFAYQHLVEADALRFSLRRLGSTAEVARLTTPQLLKLAAGGSARVTASIPRGYALFENLQFELTEAPKGITLSEARVQQNDVAFTVQADSTVNAGTRSNLIVEIRGQRPASPNARPGQQAQRVVLGYLPAIPFEVVAR